MNECMNGEWSITYIQEHMQSYDHHHTVRLKEMKARERNRFGGDRKAKERAREQKALKVRACVPAMR